MPTVSATGSSAKVPAAPAEESVVSCVATFVATLHRSHPAHHHPRPRRGATTVAARTSRTTWYGNQNATTGTIHPSQTHTRLRACPRAGDTASASTRLCHSHRHVTTAAASWTGRSSRPTASYPVRTSALGVPARAARSNSSAAPNDVTQASTCTAVTATASAIVPVARPPGTGGRGT